MKTTNTNKASTYRLPTVTTPENLETRLMGDAEDTFEDNGHAIAWAMAH